MLPAEILGHILLMALSQEALEQRKRLKDYWDRSRTVPATQRGRTSSKQQAGWTDVTKHSAKNQPWNRGGWVGIANPLRYSEVVEEGVYRPRGEGTTTPPSITRWGRAEGEVSPDHALVGWWGEERLQNLRTVWATTSRVLR